MKNSNPILRSYSAITPSDFKRLLEIARQDREDFFAMHPDWARYYKDRVIATALCQGAALHHIKPEVGINDFDVYTFYASHAERPWYARRIKRADFGDQKFGRSEESQPRFVGRRVDLLSRGLDVPVGTDARNAIVNYLRSGATPTARELAQKAVVLLDPHMGSVIWP